MNRSNMHKRQESRQSHQSNESAVQRLIQSRVVSSVEESKDSTPIESVRYVEVPVVKEKIIQIPRKEIYEIEKVIPVYDYQYRERVVEVPQVETINTEVEVEQVQEVLKKVPVKQIIEVPKEIIRYVTKVVTKVVEKEVEVAGDVIQIPRPFTIENEVIIPRYINEEFPMVVNQIIDPSVHESTNNPMEITLIDYEPYLVPVEVFVPKPIIRKIVPVAQTHLDKVIDVPPSQFNALVRASNAGATDKDVDGLLVKQLDGSIPMLNLPDFKVLQPISNAWKKSSLMV